MEAVFLAGVIDEGPPVDEVVGEACDSEGGEEEDYGIES